MNRGIKDVLKEKFCNRKVVLMACIAILLKLGIVYGILRLVPDPITILVAIASVKWLVIPALFLIWRVYARMRSTRASNSLCQKE